MKGTAEILQRFVGGQLEDFEYPMHITNCGEIKEIEVDGHLAYIMFAWRAKKEYARNPSQWVKLIGEDSLEIAVRLDLMEERSDTPEQLVLNFRYGRGTLVFQTQDFQGLLDPAEIVDPLLLAEKH